MKLCYLLLIFLNIYIKVNCLYFQDLGGIWKLATVDSEFKNLSANVPGGVYTDLMNNEIIGDVFFGYNDTETRWVANQEWIYSTVFLVNETVLRCEYINLILNGVDTFSEIIINKELIGKTDNMFVRYVFNVKNVLQLGSNEIIVKFSSPIKKANEMYVEQLKSYKVPPDCVPKVYNGECHVNHIRKMQASFGWDWGPAILSIGIWKSIYLESYNSSVIRDVVIKTVKNDETFEWEISLNIYYARNINDVRGSVIVTLHHDMGKIVTPFLLNISENEDGDFVSKHVIIVNQNYVKLWWPNGYGNQNLYDIDITYVNPENTNRMTKTYKIGFRELELMQNELNPKGREFLFKVNGRIIFAKGSNVIPINILPEKENVTTIRYLLQSAKDVNMNMLRVWGGGIYESDEFYNIADEFGILIWQDFAFACSMYPSSEKFLATVKEEVKYQVKRLQRHPCIALWAGNNENEIALRTNWYDTVLNFTLYKNDYVKLYVETIKNLVLKYDDTREYLTSSPTNGIESEEEGYVAKDPGSNFYGDVHYYNYVEDGWNINTFPIPRFSSEYGYQSLPSLKTLLTATKNLSDLEINSEFMNHRQHHPTGYTEMKWMMNFQFNMDSISDENYRDAFIFFSQVYQAMSIKTETEHYRSYMGILNDEGQGWTYGALYWQLNDVWVAPSWSSIDFYLKWKMLHYYAKDFFAPLIITGQLNTDRNLDVYVVNEKLPLFNVTVYLRIYQWQSFNEFFNRNITLDIPLGKSTRIDIGITQVDTFLQDNKCGTLVTAKINCFFVLDVQDAKGNTIVPFNFVIPSSIKTLNLQKPNIKIAAITEITNKSYTIEIETSSIALFVWLDCDVRGRFSENGFIQIVPKKIITFNSESATSLTVLKASLVLTHLLDDKYK